mgnify:FL=1|tara:strand:+ start:1857 stop:2192 length:336 start_codon:yes stop_codon:yes gene_type:complete
MEQIDKISLDVAVWLTPILALSLSLIIGLALKNAITNFLCGVKFIMGEAFNSGDLVIIDGTQQALIIKVGLYETIFQTQHDGQTLWRHVPNSRLDFMNISRVIQQINENEQ